MPCHSAGETNLHGGYIRIQVETTVKKISAQHGNDAVFFARSPSKYDYSPTKAAQTITDKEYTRQTQDRNMQSNTMLIVLNTVGLSARG